MSDTSSTTGLDDFIAKAIPLVHGMGLRHVLAEPGQVEARMPIEGNSNHLGTMYAGALFTVAEVLGGTIVFTSFEPGYLPIVKNVRIDYLKPAQSDVTASASLEAAEIERIATTAGETGRCDFDLTTKITTADGTVVATTTGTYQIRAM